MENYLNIVILPAHLLLQARNFNMKYLYLDEKSIYANRDGMWYGENKLRNLFYV